MPLLDDWVDNKPDAWDYEKVLTENEVKILLHNDSWYLHWHHGGMGLGATSKTIARKAAALFVSLWLRGVSASFADKLMDGFIVFLERQEGITKGFTAKAAETPPVSGIRKKTQRTRQLSLNVTTLVNIRRGESCDVLITRASQWGNPFQIEPRCSKEQAIAKYEEYIRQRPDLLAQLPTLVGKRLGCYCHPLPCHGNVLIKLMRERGLIE